MIKQIKNITLVFFVLTGFFLMGATCFQCNDAKDLHTVLKATSNHNFEFLAEMEEDETEQDDHLNFDVIPFLHFLFENLYDKHCKPASLAIADSSAIQGCNSFQSKICVFRI